MAGIFDFLTPDDPMKQQSLLAAAAAMLQGSGDPHRPFGFGQALAGGVTGYQQSQQAQQDRGLQLEQARQLAQMRDFAIKDKQSDLETQDAQRQRAKGLLSLTSDYWKNGAQPQGAAPAFPGGQPAAGMLQGVLNAQAGGQAQPAPAPPGGAPGGGLDRGSMTNQRLAYAQFLRQHGYGTEAQSEEDSALKLQPKVKEWQKVTVGDKVLYAPYFEDGSSGQPVPLEVAEKLDKVNRGGSTEMVNPFTGATVRSMTNTASPEALIAAATQRRGQDITARGQNMADARAREQNTLAAGAKPPTEFQGKSAAFGLRATEANKTLGALEGQYSPTGVNAKNALGSVWGIGGALGAGANALLSDSSQRVDQAQRDFINAILRQESGAAIGASEFDNAAKQYFPQPGDSDAVKGQKARNRALAIQGLQANAGRAALTAPAASGGWSITKVE